MINVIEHGNTYHETICTTCYCKFSYTRTDIMKYDGVKEVRCPECNSCNEVGE